MTRPEDAVDSTADSERWVPWATVISLGTSVYLAQAMNNYVGYPENDFPFLGHWALLVVSMAALLFFTVTWLVGWNRINDVDSDDTVVVPRIAIAAALACLPLLWAQLFVTGRSQSVVLLSCLAFGVLAFVFVERTTARGLLRLGLPRRLTAACVGAVVAAVAILPPHVQQARVSEWRAAASAFSAIVAGSESLDWVGGEALGTIAILSVSDQTSLSPAWHHLPKSLRAHTPREAEFVALVRTVKEPLGRVTVDGRDTPLFRCNLAVAIHRCGERQPLDEFTIRGASMSLGYARYLVHEDGEVAIDGFPGSRVVLEENQPVEVLTAPKGHLQVAGAVRRRVERL